LRTTTPRSDQRRQARSTERTATLKRVRPAGLPVSGEPLKGRRVCADLKPQAEMGRSAAVRYLPGSKCQLCLKSCVSEAIFAPLASIFAGNRRRDAPAAVYPWARKAQMNAYGKIVRQVGVIFCNPGREKLGPFPKEGPIVLLDRTL
jgi:hypothetical protein